MSGNAPKPQKHKPRSSTVESPVSQKASNNYKRSQSLNALSASPKAPKHKSVNALQQTSPKLQKHKPRSSNLESPVSQKASNNYKRSQSLNALRVSPKPQKHKPRLSTLENPVIKKRPISHKRAALVLNEKWEKTVVEVYEKPKHNESPAIAQDLYGVIRGIWADGYQATESNPVDVWIYPKGLEPKNLLGCSHIYGEWGFKPNDSGKYDIHNVDPGDLWFFGPNSKSKFLTKVVVKHGFWTYPQIQQDSPSVSPKSPGCSNVGKTSESEYTQDEQNGNVLKLPVLKSYKITVFIVTPHQQKFFVDGLEPLDTIAIIKQKIEEKKGISKEAQRIMWGGKELEDTATLKEKHIINGSTMDLDGMRIFVKPYKCKTIELNVEPTNTILDVMKMIEERNEIPLKDQRFLADINDDNLLDDDKTLEDYNVQHGDTLHLQPMQIYIKKPSGVVYRLNVTPNETVLQIKKKLEKQEGIQLDEQRYCFGDQASLENYLTLQDYDIKHRNTIELEGMIVLVEHWNGEKIELDVDPLDAMDSVQDKIAEKLEIPMHHQRLFFNQRHLDDELYTLRDYKVLHKSILQLEPMIISIRKPLGGGKFQLTVTPDDTIDYVKRRIEEQENFPKEEQRILLSGNDLLDKTTLAEHSIQHGCTLELGDMKLYIINKDGREFTLDTEPTYTIDDVKSKITQQELIPKDSIALACEGQPLLDENMSLRDYGIPHESILQIIQMQIHILTPSGKNISLDVDPEDKILEIKERIAAKTNIPRDEQRLLFGEAKLGDAYQLQVYNIVHGSTIDMEPMSIHVHDWMGGHLTFDVDPADTIGSVKSLIEVLEGIPMQHQRLFFGKQLLEGDEGTSLRDCGITHHSHLDLRPISIFIKTPMGKKIILEVDPSHTIEEIKHTIQEKEGTPVAEQRLMYDEDELDDDTTLAENQITDGMTLDLEGMQVYLKDWTGKKYAIQTAPNEAIVQLKEKIQEKGGISSDRQYLFFSGELLEDELTLAEYGIRHLSIVELERMTISVNTPERKEILLHVEPSHTVQDVKKMIKEKEGVSIESQKLIYENAELDDATTLADNQIAHGSALDLEFMQIYVKDWTGKSFEILTAPNETISQLKEKIMYEEGISIDQQHLFVSGVPLEDEPTLAEYGIGHLSTVELERMTISVQDWTGKTFKIQTGPNDTISLLKRKIMHQEEIPIGKQYLLFDDDLLEDEPTLADCGIRHLSVVELERLRIYVDGPQDIFPLDVDSTTKIKAVKDMSGEKVGIAPGKMLVLFKDQKLKAASSLAECGVEYGDTLKVRQRPQVYVPTHFKVLNAWQNPFNYNSKNKR